MLKHCSFGSCIQHECAVFGWVNTLWVDTDAMAIEAWNTRAPSPITTRLEALTREMRLVIDKYEHGETVGLKPYLNKIEALLRKA